MGRFALDPRTKLYLLLIGNLLLFFHVDLQTEMLLMLFFLVPFYLSGKWKSGLRLTLLYTVLVLMDLYLVPASEGTFLTWISMLAVTVRMMLPCVVTGAYAFSTTGVGEFVCALRRARVPEAIVIPCMVVIRFFPTIGEDYRQIKNAMALRGIGGGVWETLCHPMKRLEYIVIPLLMNSNNVAQDLSAAALTKGLGIDGVHTCMTEIRLTAMDGAYAVICTLPLICAIVR